MMEPRSASQDLVGVVLAGGVSRRMGRDKATLEIGGETLVARAARKLGEVVGEVVLADGGRDLLRGVAASVVDGPGHGPAAGVLGAALARPGRALLVLACDLPGVSVGLLRTLAVEAPAAGLVIPRWRRGVEPLCARWGPGAVDALARRVAAGRLDLHGVAEEPDLRVATVEGTALEALGDPEVLLANVNTPADLEAVAPASSMPE